VTADDPTLAGQAEIYAALTEVFQEVFPFADVSPTAAMTSEDVEGWDSLGHVGLIVALEDRFGIEFATEEYVAFDNVGELVQMIQSKLRK
jgi:acyl carrier protein